MKRLLVIAFGVVALAAPDTALGAFPGADGRIAFDRNGGLAILNPAGTSSLVTGCYGGGDFQISCEPAWSPDGSYIAYGKQVGEDDEGSACDADVFKLNPSGGGEFDLTSNGTGFCGPDDNQAAWSPDGAQIVYRGTVGSTTGLYRMNAADGSGKTLVLADGGAIKLNPSWSPSGTRIAFSDFIAGTSQIFTVNPDGTGLTQLTTLGGERPSWSPDGGRVAFENSVSGNLDVYAINADGTGLTRLTTDPDRDFQPAWSPSGRKIAFAHGPSGTVASNIYTMNSDGSGRAQITTGDADSAPDWQPLPNPDYERPGSAAQIAVSLVPLFKQCGIGGNPANAKHAPPLATSSCNPPRPGSDVAQVGPASQGTAAMTVVPGDSDPSNGNQADVSLTLSLTDVQTPAGADYDPNPSGADMAEGTRLRITDSANGYGGGAATATDLDFGYFVDCTPTAGAEGSSCTASTSANAVVPGSIVEQKSTVIQVFRVRLYDSGPNALIGDGDDRLFAHQGVFVP